MKPTFAFRNGDCLVRVEAPGTGVDGHKYEAGNEVDVLKRDGSTSRVLLERIVRRETGFVFYSFSNAGDES